MMTAMCKQTIKCRGGEKCHTDSDEEEGTVAEEAWALVSGVTHHPGLMWDEVEEVYPDAAITSVERECRRHGLTSNHPTIQGDHQLTGMDPIIPR